MSQSPLDQLKYQFKYGGAHIKLLIWNVAIFLVLALTRIIAYLFDAQNDIDLFIAQNLRGNTYGEWMLTHFWTAFTYMWIHVDLLHIAFNMLMLYFVGQMLTNIVGAKRTYFIYIAGGLFAFIIYFLAHNGFPALYKHGHSTIEGASGAIMAMFIALVTLAPNMKVHLFGVFGVRLIYLGIIYVLMDVLRIDDGGRTAYFAHLGGALFGFLFAYSYRKGTDMSAWFNFSWVKKIKFKKSKLRVSHSNANASGARKKDDEFNASKVDRQKKIDRILDKIKSSGYDSLSKEEKDFLFRESKNV